MEYLNKTHDFKQTLRKSGLIFRSSILEIFSTK